MKLKVHYLIIMVFLGVSSVKAQLNVGSTSAADASAILQATSTTKGFLPPVMTTIQRNAIVTPAPGLLIFNSTTNQQEVNSGTTTTPIWGANTAATFYNANGTLAANRTVTQGSNTLSYLGTGGIKFKSGNVNFDSSALTGLGDSLSGGVTGIGITLQGGLNMGQSTTGNNIFIGYKAGKVTTGANNQFIGFQSGSKNTSGYTNVFSGDNSGLNNTTGFGNTFTGFSSGQNNNTGAFNLFSGAYSGGSNTSGSGNVFNGYASGQNNTSGSNNTFNGDNSGQNTTDGGQNVFTGTNAGINNTSGTNNTSVGFNAGPATAFLTNTTSIGYNTQATASNTVILGTGANVGINTTTPSHNLEVNGSVGIITSNIFELGVGLTKEMNAGKIGYGTFSSGTSLDIVGAGTVSGSRSVHLIDNVSIEKTLQIGSLPASTATQIVTTDVSGNLGQRALLPVVVGLQQQNGVNGVSVDATTSTFLYTGWTITLPALSKYMVSVNMYNSANTSYTANSSLWIRSQFSTTQPTFTAISNYPYSNAQTISFSANVNNNYQASSGVVYLQNTNNTPLTLYYFAGVVSTNTGYTGSLIVALPGGESSITCTPIY